MIRDIVEIDEAKCDGCGQCIPSCAEGALYLEGGKVRLKADALCDGLGACLGECPRGALRVTRRDAEAFDEALVRAGAAPPRPPPLHAVPSAPATGGCPGSRPRTLAPPAAAHPRPRLSVVAEAPPPLAPSNGSRLGQWPVQLHLVPPNAPYLAGADLLVAADCVPFAYARFHEELLDGRRVLVGCPKLDDLRGYVEKLTEMFRTASPRSVTVAKMEVPCCNGIAAAAQQALARSGSSAPLEVVTIAITGTRVE